MERGAELIARARLICGEPHVLTHPSVLAVFRSDGRRRDGPLPLAAILPGSASEVASVVAACAATGLPYVVRGAGTSHSGGALPRADAALVILTRMRRILSAHHGELTVQAGVPVDALPRARSGQAWLAGVTAGATAVGTVGGHVAEVSRSANIAALELVRPDGSLLQLDAGRPGYDVSGAFPGSRGSAGIAVTLTLRPVHP